MKVACDHDKYYVETGTALSCQRGPEGNLQWTFNGTAWNSAIPLCKPFIEWAVWGSYKQCIALNSGPCSKGMLHRFRRCVLGNDLPPSSNTREPKMADCEQVYPGTRRFLRVSGQCDVISCGDKNQTCIDKKLRCDGKQDCPSNAYVHSYYPYLALTQTWTWGAWG